MLAGILIVRVTAAVVANYGGYLPPDFDTEFLTGREAYFFGIYRWAFYLHIGSSPATLIFGLLLINNRFRMKWPTWHRQLGKFQSMLVLFLVVPSGLWMAFYAEAGLIAETGFASLAIATGICVVTGWRTAVQRRFTEHRRWMWRCYLLLCSAVVLRLMGGIAHLARLDTNWTYPMAAWLSWLGPLLTFETLERRGRTK